MTTVFPERVTCGVCGARQTIDAMGSTNTFGPMDLDTRPAEMRRSTMWLWVHECKKCGFVAADLESTEATDGGVVKSDKYLAELRSDARERLVNQFICRSMLDEAAGELTEAGWRRLHAAWVCDDSSAVTDATTLRRQARELFTAARRSGMDVIPEPVGGEALLLADIARRSGEFHLALEHCQSGLALEPPAFIRGLLTLEQKLAEARDTSRHDVGEVQDT